MSNSKNTIILKNTGILYFRLIVSSISGLLASRLLLQNLGVLDFGLYSVVGGIVVMMNFLNTVMTSTSFRFIAFELGKGDAKGVNTVFNISLIIHIAIIFTIVILAETIGVYYVNNIFNIPSDKIEDALFVLRLSILATTFTIFSIPYQGLITAKENFTTRALIEIFSSLFTLALIVVMTYYNGNQLRLYAFIILLVKIFTSLLFIISCKRRYSSVISINIQKDYRKYKEMLSFSGWIMIGAAASVGKVQGAALIINAFFGTVLNTSFGIANQVNTLVLMFSNNLGQAAIPQITKSYSSGNTVRTKQLVTYISKYSFFLMLFPSIPILLETDFILNLWLVEVPIDTDVFIKFMIVNALINTINSGLPTAIQATGKIKYFQIILSTITLSSLPISYYLFTLGYAPYFIIVVFIVVAIINTIVRQILLKIIINFDVKYYITKTFLRALFVLIFVSPLFFIRMLFTVDDLLSFIIFIFFSLIWVLFSIYLVGTDKKERDLIGYEIKKTINFLKFRY